MKALKLAGLTLALILALLLIMALLLPRLIDPNQYRAQLEQAAYQHTGLDVQLDGPIEWSVFPWLGLSLNELKVADRQQRPLASLSEVQASIRLLPLLGGQLEMDRLLLNGLHLNLIRDAKGRGNWTLAAQDATQSVVNEPAAANAEPSSPAPTTTPESGKPLALNIAAIELSDLVIDYQDLASGQKLHLGPASLRTGAIRLDQPFALEAMLPLSSNQPALEGLVQLNSQVLLKPDGVRLDQLGLTFSPANGSSSVSLSGTVQYLQQTLDLQLTLAPLNPKQLMQELGLAAPETRDDQALTQLSLLLRAQGNQNQLKIDPLTLELDGFNLSGPITLENLQKQPAIRFTLSGDELDLDRYLAPPKPASEQSAETQSASANQAVTSASGELIPASTRAALRPLDIAGSLKLKALKVADLPLEEPKLELALKDARLRIKTLEAGLFSGRIQHQSQLDLRQTPALESRTQLTSVQVQPLAQALAEVDQFSGALNSDAQLNSRFKTQQELLANLNGSVGFELVSGQLQGVNLNKLVCGAIAGIRKEPMSKSDWPDLTAFTNMQGNWQIKQGIARNQDLVAKLDQLALDGAGSINLPARSLDYRSGLTVLGATAAEDEPACRINPKYAKVRWPVRCEGSFGQKGLCRIDTEALAQEVAKLYGSELEEKLNQKVEEKLGEDAGKLLKGLFN